MAKIVGPNREQILQLLHQGDAYLESHQNEMAISSYQEALALQPNIGEAHYRIAVACMRLGLQHVSIEILNKSVKFYKSAESFNLLGKCLSLSGEFDKANQAYRKALKADKKDVVAVAGIADVIAYKGNYEEAYKMLIPLMKKRFTDMELANTITRICTKIGRFDEARAYLEEIAGKDETDTDEIKGQVLYMIGDVLDKQKNYTAALEYYLRANGTRELAYDESFYERLRDSIKSVYGDSGLESLHQSGSESVKPIFIVGMPRSGTTLIEQILASHSKVHGAGELSHMSNYVLDWARRSGSAYPYCMKHVSPQQLEHYANDYLAALTGEGGPAERVIDKMPHNFVYIGFIKQLFPNCKIIYCRRNPIDTCMSIYFTRFNDSHPYATHFENLAHQYKYCVDSMEFWKQQDVDILEVYYEDTVMDLENSVRRIIEFCDLEMEQGCLEFHKNTRFVNTASKEQVNKPLYTSSIERWRNYLPGIQPLVDSLSEYGLPEG